MTKRTAQPTRTGQLVGAEIKIGEIHNDGLREHVVIVNRGTLPQPMGGWALATLRGERFFFFPDDAILPPGKTLCVHSGQDAQKSLRASLDLFWTDEQMWNNRRDTAVLFDANGTEVDRHTYPPKSTRGVGSAARRRKRLARSGETWRIVDEPMPEARTSPLRDKHASRR